LGPPPGSRGRPSFLRGSTRLCGPFRRLHYGWSAESLGADTLTIAADDPKLCRICILVVGVLGRASDTSFTLSYTTAEALTTLQVTTKKVLFAPRPF